MHRVIKRGIEDHLSGYPSSEFLSHLTECLACATRVAHFVSLTNVLRSLRQDEMLPVPAGFTEQDRDYITPCDGINSDMLSESPSPTELLQMI